MESWVRGELGLWRVGFVESWVHGELGSWRVGFVESWVRRTIELHFIPDQPYSCIGEPTSNRY